MAVWQVILAFAISSLFLLCARCQEEDLELRACIPANCTLPNCFCSGRKIPNGLKPTEIPQFVLFTFDDAVNDDVYSPLMAMFGPMTEQRNPNGWPISMTLFVSHMHTDHCKVAEFYQDGHEIASHSITHKEPITYWKTAPYDEYTIEIDGQRRLLSRLAGIPKEDIRGYRSPFIQPGGDTQFTVLHDRRYTYDSSLLVFSNDKEDRIWPYTLDVPNQNPCPIKPCPKKEYPGLWELPIQPIPDQTGKLCSFLDRCVEPMNEEDVYGYLRDSFNTSYNSNRGPLILNMHAYWFNKNVFGLKAFNHFIQDLVTMDDVYIVTSMQLIDWMRKPTTLSEMKSTKSKFVKRTTTRCSKQVLRDGSNLKKKFDFVTYNSRLEREIYKVKKFAPADGGTSIIVVVILATVGAFGYFVYKEKST